MLVRDPVKRYTVKQIRQHRWMTENGNIPEAEDPTYIQPPCEEKELDEDVLREMEVMGLDREKTIQVREYFIEYPKKFHQIVFNESRVKL